MAPMHHHLEAPGDLHHTEHVEGEGGEEHADRGEDGLEDDAVPPDLERLRDHAEEDALGQRVQRSQDGCRLRPEDADHGQPEGAEQRDPATSPGCCTWLVVLEISVCDQPTTPPAMTRRNSDERAGEGAVGGHVGDAGRGGGAPVASACASSTGAAQPASSSFCDRLETLLVQRRIGHDLAFPARRLRGSSVRDAPPSTSSIAVIGPADAQPCAELRRVVSMDE